MLLNITKGDYFNRYFLEKLNIDYIGNAFPFREAMIDGPAHADVFSNAFICTRAKALSVDEHFYKEKAKELLDFCENHTQYTQLCLWFGADTFCQVNLLTLLALLEKINYQGKISLYVIDDESFEILQKDIPVTLGIYTNLYQQILINHTPVANVGTLNQKAFDLYFDYLSNDGALAKFIIENREQDKDFLVKELISRTKDYGLSDINIQNLIKRVLKN